MDDTLRLLGLSEKEAQTYQLLLKSTGMTALQIANASGEKRTNVYPILENLTTKGLVLSNDKGVARYTAADPEKLRALLELKQSEYTLAATGLSSALPRLKSQYALTHNRPGVVHMAGKSGFLQLLDDMVHSQTEVLLVASNDVPDETDMLAQFRKRLLQRRENGVITRALFHHNQNEKMIRRIFTERGMELRFVGDMPFSGEVVMYENNVVFTVYKPSIIVTVVTNEAIAQTMRSLFENVWQQADICD